MLLPRAGRRKLSIRTLWTLWVREESFEGGDRTGWDVQALVSCSAWGRPGIPPRGQPSAPNYKAPPMPAAFLKAENRVLSPWPKLPLPVNKRPHYSKCLSRNRTHSIRL